MSCSRQASSLATSKSDVAWLLFDFHCFQKIKEVQQNHSDVIIYSTSTNATAVAEAAGLPDALQV